MRKSCYPDLIEKYENPIEHTCDVREGQVWVAAGSQIPVGMCESAWSCMLPFVKALASGGGNFYDGWMKNPKSAMISCNDGFRPVSFYAEALDESAERAALSLRRGLPYPAVLSRCRSAPIQLKSGLARRWDLLYNTLCKLNIRV